MRYATPRRFQMYFRFYARYAFIRHAAMLDAFATPAGHARRQLMISLMLATLSEASRYARKSR